MREKSLSLTKKGEKVVGFSKVDFDGEFDKNNPKIIKEKV